jgi:hypothetical protein
MSHGESGKSFIVISVDLRHEKEDPMIRKMIDVITDFQYDEHHGIEEAVDLATALLEHISERSTEKLSVVTNDDNIVNKNIEESLWAENLKSMERRLHECFGEGFDMKKHLTYFKVYDDSKEECDVNINDVLKKFDVKGLNIIHTWC